MPTNQLYHTWIQQIRELRPEQRITQVRNFALLMYGIYQSRSVDLSRIAGKVPGKATLCDPPNPLQPEVCGLERSQGFCR